METRALGTTGLVVPAIGLGCMGMSDFYGPSDEAQSLATLARALELGATFWDTSDMYGIGANEMLLGRFLRGARRDAVILATKFGVKRGPTGSFDGIDGRPAYVRDACDRSLARLGVDTIDLYYQHRVDRSVPIEDTVGAMADLVAAGKVRHLGLSEASAATIRRAARIHPIAAVQMEYSLWTRDAEAEILPVCRELGIGLVAYSPLGRGFLTGRYDTPERLAASDVRRTMPRFIGDNLERNRAIAAQVTAIAATVGATPAQVALRWLLDRGADVVPIPGTRRPERLAENVAALAVRMPADAAALTDALPPAAGLRYAEGAMASLNG